MASRSEASETLKVAIIGAGLGGLTLAKALLHHATEGRKVEVCLYEAWDEWKVRGGAIGLAAGKRILEKLGLKGQLAAVANQINGYQMNFHANGSKLNTLCVPGCTVMRTDLQKVLVESLPPNVVKLGHKLVEIVEGEDEVMLEFENGARASAHLVVASDGIHSFVRQKVFGVDQPEFTGFRVLYSVSSKAYRPDATVANIHWKELDGAGYGFLDLTAGQGKGRHDICVIILRSEEQVTDRWESTMVKDRLRKLAERVGSDHPVLLKAVESSEVCFDWGIYRQPLRDTWISSKGRVVLLGDAAHATAPFMGQGANMAMDDAYTLAQILRNERISLSEGMHLYETTRKAPCEAIVSKSSKVGDLHTASGMKAVFRNNFLCCFLLGDMRRVVSADPTAQKPWEESSFQKLSKKVCSICSAKGGA
ncbi:unnamed protein product [Effrenium voratum]|uniref:FAD-binding domain-containing protein n=1 Tax=Effrenium voratum TaxID=2562239 RepID=A0AA36HQ48_9DINO|nr:unnamed protein product [Effrenium voratum]|mmetsp:Transcript_75596/g.180613  ORF Transcript_75596/g.180613 Transcript_75596/m.180613 type:complete len:422 (-) Transcript_75596:212-1477(-)